MYDENDHKYMDAISGIGVCNLGHCHPAVTRTLAEQAGQLMHTSNLYRIPAQESLAQRLCELSGMENVFFSNSGAEANEAAIKIARLYGSRKQIAKPHRDRYGRQLPWPHHGDLVRHRQCQGAGRLCAVAGRLHPCAVQRHRMRWKPWLTITISLPYWWNRCRAKAASTSRQRLPGRLRTLCDRNDWLLMLDEIQSGNGRTGDYFACLGAGITPDVLTTAKGLGNGFPIGACLVAGKAEGVFGPGNHGSTYGGNPLGCATALTVVNTLTDDMVDGVADKGAWLKDAFTQAFSRSAHGDRDPPERPDARHPAGSPLCRTGQPGPRRRPADQCHRRFRGAVAAATGDQPTEMQHLVDTLSLLIHRFADEQEVA